MLSALCSATSTSLKVGDWEFLHEGIELRRVRFREVEVLRRLHVVARDAEWNTVALPVSLCEAESDRENASWRLMWRAESDASPIPLTLTGEIRVAGSTLHCAMHGVATGPAMFNRVGWCLLHPLSFAGSPAGLRGSDQTWHRSALPRLVAPQPLTDDGPAPALGPFDALTLERPARMSLTFNGDLFELEDQRNWTDASFKTYSTPLSTPRPRRLAEGEEIAQGVQIDVSEARPAAIGALITGSTRTAPSQADLGVLAEACDFARVEVRLGTDDDARRMRDLLASVRPHLPVELAILGGPTTRWAALAECDPTFEPSEKHPIDRVLVFHEDGTTGTRHECTTPALLEQARTALPDHWQSVPLGGGTLHSFCELQRHSIDHLPHVCFSISPAVHTTDEASIYESVEPIEAIVATAASRATPGAVLHVGPIHPQPRPLEQIAAASGETENVDATTARILPPEFVADLVTQWAQAGAETICALDARMLVADAALTEWGRAIASARRCLVGLDTPPPSRASVSHMKAGEHPE